MIKSFSYDDTFGKKTIINLYAIFTKIHKKYLGSDSEDVLLPTRLSDASCL